MTRVSVLREVFSFCIVFFYFECIVDHGSLCAKRSLPQGLMKPLDSWQRLLPSEHGE